MKSGRYAEALDYFSRALRVDRDNPRYQQNYRAAQQLKGAG
jgi:tetratricopeptide (TPR) repeat protein